jgi:hypothetical protein
VLLCVFFFAPHSAWAERIIKGKIKCKDDKMGSDETDINGEYKIKFAGKHWGPDISGTAKRHSDIFAYEFRTFPIVNLSNSTLSQFGKRFMVTFSRICLTHVHRLTRI